MTKKIISLLSISSVILLSACSQEKIKPIKGEKTSSHNTLIENIGSDIPSLDPQQESDIVSNRVVNDLFEGLVEYNQKSEIIPTGAERWDVSQDELTYTFYLRKNAIWTNGDPVTAKDYVYSYRRAVTPDTMTRAYVNYFNPIVNSKAIQAGTKSPDTLGVTAKSKYVLQIKLATPNPTFIASLTLPCFIPINQKAVDKHGTAWANIPSTIISNGAYKLSKWIHNGYAEAVKNPDYWNNENVSIDKVRYLMISDAASDMQNYSAGKEGITNYTLPANADKWYKSHFPKQYTRAPTLSQTFYIFNMREDKFKDIRVRKALSMTIDRDGLTKGVLQQGQEPSYLVIPKSISEGRYKDIYKDIPGYEWVDQPLDQRIQTARKLLKEAGYTTEHPLYITINFNTSNTNRNIALVIQAVWNQSFDGVVVAEVFNEDWKVYLSDLDKGNFDIARLGWSADFNEPNTYTEMYTCSSTNNRGNYCNKEADKLYYKSIQMEDKEEFYKLQRELIIKQTKDYPIIPLFIAPYNRLVQSYVKNFDPAHNIMGVYTTKDFKIKHA